MERRGMRLRATGRARAAMPAAPLESPLPEERAAPGPRVATRNREGAPSEVNRQLETEARSEVVRRAVAAARRAMQVVRAAVEPRRAVAQSRV